jgi:hypothetical protein
LRVNAIKQFINDTTFISLINRRFGAEIHEILITFVHFTQIELRYALEIMISRSPLELSRAYAVRDN